MGLQDGRVIGQGDHLLPHKFIKRSFEHWSHHFMANRWGNNGHSERFILRGSKITADGDCSHEIKRCLLLGGKAMTNLAAAAAAKSLQSCPTLCDPIDSSPPGSPVPGILQARTLEWGAIALKWQWLTFQKTYRRNHSCAS